MLDNFRNHMIIKDQSENSNNNVHYIDDFTTTENNIKFKKTDMLDEYKNPYKIIIWTGEKGTPIYRATPSVCMANISCDITYDQTDHSSAHAIVFKADSIDEGHLPTNRYVRLQNGTLKKGWKARSMVVSITLRQSY